MRDDQDHGSDQRITEAYERHAVALAPPPDVMVGVERRIGVRRSRRRTPVAGSRPTRRMVELPSTAAPSP